MLYFISGTFISSLVLSFHFPLSVFPFTKLFSSTPPPRPLPSPVVTDVCRPRRFPPWCGRAALWGSWAGIALASGVSIWAGHGFSQSVAMMWLISCFASFLCSCLLLEPIKVDTQTHTFILRDASLHTYVLVSKLISCPMFFNLKLH